MDTLERRVGRLERQNRVLKLGAVLVLAIAGGVLLMGQASQPGIPNELRTRRLAVVDEAGKDRLVLVVDRDGPVLMLGDDVGNRQVALGVAPSGPRLLLYDQAGRVGVALSTSKDGPGLLMYDEAGNTRAMLTSIKLMGPSLILNDEAGKMRVVLGALKEGPKLGLQDAEGYMATLGAAELVTPTTGTKEKRSAASLVMSDKDGHPIWRAPE